MKRVFIIHGWEGSPKNNWFPWLKKELESRNFEVVVPKMPEPRKPRKEIWVNFLRDLIKPNQNTFLVGHSIGCMAIMRYLETLPENETIGGVVCVGAWLILRQPDDLDEDEKEIVKDWLNPPLNFEKVKKIGNKFSAIFSDNDPFVDFDNQRPFREKLGANIVIESGKGHFDDEAGIKELPVVLEELLKMSQ
jgi:hypothetical protein